MSLFQRSETIISVPLLVVRSSPDKLSGGAIALPGNELWKISGFTPLHLKITGFCNSFMVLRAQTYYSCGGRRFYGTPNKK